MVDVAVKSTRTALVSRPVIAVIQPDGIVAERERVDDSPSATSTATTAAVFPFSFFSCK